MKKVFIRDTALTAEAIEQLILIYKAISKLEAKANNLRGFLSVEISAPTLKEASYCIYGQPFDLYASYLVAEPSDDVIGLFNTRMKYAPYVAAMG